MIYVCTQPEIPYFAWQIDVMLHSFRKVGVNMHDVHIVGSIGSGEFEYLKDKYPGVQVFNYKDDRPDKSYIPSVKHWLMYKHYEAQEWLNFTSVFWHDCDIAFTKKPDFSHLIDDDKWYLSDTVSYLGYDYIKEKGDDTLSCMLNSMDMPEDLVKQNQENSGGAQYILKGVDKFFWLKCYYDGVKMYKDICPLEEQKLKDNSDYKKLQVWTAEMWSTLWNAWLIGKQTRVVESMNFCWATDKIEKWDQCYIYHNAGVTDANSGMFFKGGYIHTNPAESDLELDPNKCSYRYYQLLKEANLKNH